MRFFFFHTYSTFRSYPKPTQASSDTNTKDFPTITQSHMTSRALIKDDKNAIIGHSTKHDLHESRVLGKDGQCFKCWQQSDFTSDSFLQVMLTALRNGEHRLLSMLHSPPFHPTRMYTSHFTCSTAIKIRLPQVECYPDSSEELLTSRHLLLKLLLRAASRNSDG